ncbi:MAG: efflux RND transporter periplasmic adaptor subunit [Planctomycetota bacterium]
MIEYDGIATEESAELRQQLRTLSIPREQRPGGRRTARAGNRLAAALLVGMLGCGGYFGWLKYGAHLPWPRTGTAALSLDGPTIRVALHPAPAPAPLLTATGRIVSDHRVEVATKVSGQIVGLHFEQGDAVERGQVLAQIDDELPRARRDEAAANLSRARAQVEFQQANYARLKGLRDENRATDIEYADARRADEEARALLQAAEAQLAAAEKILRDCQVPAPISGVVLERNVEVGDFVAAEGGRGAMANAQFGAIADMRNLRVEVDVSELDIHRLRSGMPCMIVPDARKERRYEGSVLWIDPGANYAKATVQVKVRILNPDDALRVDGAAQVQFLPDQAPAARVPALWIPQHACQPDADGTSARVYVAEAGRFRAAPVKLGRRAGDLIEVTAGLSEGQEIAAKLDTPAGR